LQKILDDLPTIYTCDILLRGVFSFLNQFHEIALLVLLAVAYKGLGKQDCNAGINLSFLDNEEQKCTLLLP